MKCAKNLCFGEEKQVFFLGQLVNPVPMRRKSHILQPQQSRNAVKQISLQIVKTCDLNFTII